ncbi:Phenylalanyl-tRNA synthetase, beta subunit, cytoplasmic, variant 3 [Balamuthia mandrillaris]
MEEEHKQPEAIRVVIDKLLVALGEQKDGQLLDTRRWLHEQGFHLSPKMFQKEVLPVFQKHGLAYHKQRVQNEFKVGSATKDKAKDKREQEALQKCIEEGSPEFQLWKSLADKSLPLQHAQNWERNSGQCFKGALMEGKRKGWVQVISIAATEDTNDDDEQAEETKKKKKTGATNNKKKKGKMVMMVERTALDVDERMDDVGNALRYIHSISKRRTKEDEDVEKKYPKDLLQEMKKRGLIHQKSILSYDLRVGPHFRSDWAKLPSDLTSYVLHRGSWKDKKEWQRYDYSWRQDTEWPSYGGLHPMYRFISAIRTELMQIGLMELSGRAPLLGRYNNSNALRLLQQQMESVCNVDGWYFGIQRDLGGMLLDEEYEESEDEKQVMEKKVVVVQNKGRKQNKKEEVERFQMMLSRLSSDWQLSDTISLLCAFFSRLGLCFLCASVSFLLLHLL